MAQLLFFTYFSLVISMYNITLKKTLVNVKLKFVGNAYIYHPKCCHRQNFHVPLQSWHLKHKYYFKKWVQLKEKSLRDKKKITQNSQGIRVISTVDHNFGQSPTTFSVIMDKMQLSFRLFLNNENGNQIFFFVKFVLLTGSKNQFWNYQNWTFTGFFWLIILQL